MLLSRRLLINQSNEEPHDRNHCQQTDEIQTVLINPVPDFVDRIEVGGIDVVMLYK